MTRAAYLMIASTSLSACAVAAAPAAPSVYLAAHRLGEEAARESGPALTSHPDATVKRTSLASISVRSPELPARTAAREPSEDRDLGSFNVFPWSEGEIYRLSAAPEQISDITLQAGESLLSVAAGDTVRWVIGDTQSGTGTSRRTHILVKPTAPGLRTNLVIATDRRVYNVEVESAARTPISGISWIYPDDGLLAVQNSPAPPPQPVAAAVTVDALNFDYEIEGDKPQWRPIRAFDDGRQVFIEFPPTIEDGEAPPLFVTAEGGRAELVDYRVRGRYYVVDRLFTAAELRLGERHQQVVRIIRSDPRASRRSGS